MLFDRKPKPETSDNLRLLGFKPHERKTISRVTLDRLRSVPEYKPLVEKIENGLLDLEIVEDKEEVEKEVSGVYLEEQEEPLKVVPLNEPIPTPVPITGTPVIRVGGSGGSPPIVTTSKPAQKDKTGVTMIEVTKELRDTLKKLKGGRTYDELLREQFGI